MESERVSASVASSCWLIEVREGRAVCISVAVSLHSLSLSSFWCSSSGSFPVPRPVIIVGQNVVAQTGEARAEADHETLQLLHEISTRQLEILQEQRESQQKQDAVLAAILAKLGAESLGKLT